MLWLDSIRTTASLAGKSGLVRFALSLAFAACSTVTGNEAFAAGYYSGAVVTVQAYGSNTNALFVNISGTVGQSPPSCATQNYRFVVSPATDAGKAQIAVILSALARGATVWIQGTGACDIWPDTESILLLTSN
jgi:hypothetical protein